MRAHTNDVLFYKTLIFVNALLPLTLIFWDLAHAQAGVNPIESALRTFGVLALIFLLISLSITPMRKIFGWGTLIKYRRTLGLFAFFLCLFAHACVRGL
jgi:sulfoxide reductase heme-binding subunit YedZ